MPSGFWGDQSLDEMVSVEDKNSKVGEIDLSPIAHLDEDDKDMVAKCSAMFGGLKPDELEDAIRNYRTEARYSVDAELFKEILSR